MFGVVVLGCIADKLYEDVPFTSTKLCVFHAKDIANLDFKETACQLGIGCGALALILAIVFCILDLLTDVMGNAEQIRRPSIAVSSGLAIVMGILWLACFAYL